MPKGFFAQGMVVLLDQEISVDELREALADFTVVNQVEQGESWQISGPSVVVEYRPDVNGYVSVDVVGHLWPDTMGDPKEDPMLFAAWSMGHFGPYAFPRGLRRACEQPHHWPSADAAVKRHNAFLRLQLSYVFGGGPDAPVMPDDCDAQQELRFLSAMVETLLEHEAAICYFNPGGEVLLDAAALAESLQFHADLDLPPFDAWCNVRLFDVEDGWMLMDSVGNWQLDIPDHEVGFPKPRPTQYPVCHRGM